MASVPDIFNLLTGRRLEVFATICSLDKPIDSQGLAMLTNCKVATARTILRQMSYAGLVTRMEGAFDGGSGRKPDQFVVKASVRKWWSMTEQTFGVNMEQGHDAREVQ